MNRQLNQKIQVQPTPENQGEADSQISESTATKLVDYEYLKTWLSEKEIREIREGKNNLGIKLSRQSAYLIMKGRVKNFPFLNLLIKKAKENEKISTLQA
ncbi:MAG: hypothetical protein QM762_12880 [Chryseolinea sp.]